jgi:predicted nucleic acid-binding protein
MEEIGAGPVALDTAVFIYFVEEDARFVGPVQELLAAVAAGKLMAVTSALTLLEVLVIPLRHGNRGVAERYEALLTRSRGLRMVQLDLEQLRTAAQVRATCPATRTPDALQLAAALTTGCCAFVTNDRRLSSIPPLRVFQLADWV